MKKNTKYYSLEQIDNALKKNLDNAKKNYKINKSNKGDTLYQKL